MMTSFFCFEDMQSEESGTPPYGHLVKVEWSPKMDQKVCLNMVKKYQ